jgi:hypothetical protein
MQTNILSLQPAGRYPEASIPQDYMTPKPLLVASSTGYRCPNFFGYEMWLANLAAKTLRRLYFPDNPL